MRRKLSLSLLNHVDDIPSMARQECLLLGAIGMLLGLKEYEVSGCMVMGSWLRLHPGKPSMEKGLDFELQKGC